MVFIFANCQEWSKTQESEKYKTFLVLRYSQYYGATVSTTAPQSVLWCRRQYYGATEICYLIVFILTIYQCRDTTQFVLRLPQLPLQFPHLLLLIEGRRLLSVWLALLTDETFQE